MNATVTLVSVVVTLIQNFSIFHRYHCVLFRALTYLKPGVIFSLGVFRVGYNVHESFATFGEIRDSEGGRKEREKEKTRYPDQPVREKSRPFIRIRKFLSDISSFLRDGTRRHMVSEKSDMLSSRSSSFSWMLFHNGNFLHALNFNFNMQNFSKALNFVLSKAI